jgi:hypothetical protein
MEIQWRICHDIGGKSASRSVDGTGAALRHRSAAALRGIRETARARPEVNVPRRCERPGVDAHRIALADDEVTAHHGVPVTTPGRTLLDLTATTWKGPSTKRSSAG